MAGLRCSASCQLCIKVLALPGSVVSNIRIGTLEIVSAYPTRFSLNIAPIFRVYCNLVLRSNEMKYALLIFLLKYALLCTR